MKRWLAVALAALVVGASAAYAEEPTVWGKPITKTATATSNATNTVLWTPGAGNVVVLMGCVFSASAPSDVSLNGSTEGTFLQTIRLQSGGLWPVGYGTFPLWMSGTADETLRFTVTTSGTFSITCSGYEKPESF